MSSARKFAVNDADASQARARIESRAGIVASSRRIIKNTKNKTKVENDEGGGEDMWDGGRDIKYFWPLLGLFASLTCSHLAGGTTGISPFTAFHDAFV